MFELYVMRHSKSSWSNLNLKDFDRPLNKRGKKNAKLVCELFVTKKVNFDYVLVSSSKRTKKTLQILLKKLKKPKKIFSSKKLYLTDEKKIIEYIKKVPKTYNSILLINHEPVITNLVRELIKNHNGNLFKLLNYKFSTSAFAKINFKIKDWSEVLNKGVLKEFVRPKDIQVSKE